MLNEIKFKKSFIWTFWTIIAVVANVQERMAIAVKGGDGSESLAFVFGWFIWALMTPWIISLTRKFPFDRNTATKSLLTQIVIVLCVTILHILMEAPVIGFIGYFFFHYNIETIVTAVTSFVLFTISIRLFISAFILSVAHGVAYFDQLRKSEVEMGQLQVQLAAVQIESLRMQLQPHFLFNAHQTIIGLMLKNENEKAIKMVTRLSHLLRKSLEKTENLIPLKQELEFVTLYLEIQQVRFQDRLTFVTEIQNEALDAKVPSFILQPLVENAIKHGFEASAKRGLIELTGKKIDDRLMLRVVDNGVGLKNSITEGIGISNTKTRLIQLFGPDYQFSLTKSNGIGTVAHIDIPFQV